MTGDIRLFDQETSNNAISLTGSGFSGNIVAVNGWGQNSLTLNGDATLASVNNFNTVNLNSSHLTLQANAATTTPGVTLVANANITTTITGPGGKAGAPNATNLGSIYGTLSLAGAATITPTYQTIIRNGDVYQLASSVTGAGTSQISVVNSGALVRLTANAGAGPLLLEASVLNANQIPGLSNASAAALNNLLAYGGPSGKVEALGMAVEALPTLAGVRVAAEQLGPSVNGASIQLPLAINNLFAGTVFGRSDADIYGVLSAPAPRSFLGSAGPVFKGPAEVEPQDGSWLNVVGSTLSQQTVSSTPGYTSTFGGFIGGYDRLVAPGLRFGAALGYATGSAKTNGQTGQSLNVQTVEGLVYGALVEPTWYVKGAIGFGSLNYTSERTISFTGFHDYATGSRNGQLYTAGLDAGRPFGAAYGVFTPVASLLYTSVNQDAYREKSYAGAGLSVASQQTNSLQSGLGVKGLLPFEVSPSFSSALELRAVWRHEFLDTGESVAAAFAGGGTFEAVGPQPTRNLADIGAALRFASIDQLQKYEVSYNARLGANFAEQIGMFRARYDF